MTAEQSAEVSMLRAVRSTSDAHLPSLSGTAYARLYPEFLDRLARIDDAIQLQATQTEGATEMGSERHLALVEMLMPIASGLSLHGATTGDGILEQEGDVTDTDLKTGGINAFIGKASRIMESAGTLSTSQLGAVGLTAAQMAAATSALDRFTRDAGLVRHQQSESVRGTTELALELAGMRTFLDERLDKAAGILRTSHTAFYREYRTSREILDPSYNVRALEMTITDAATGRPLEGVRVVITPGDVEKITGPAGGFYVTRLAAGQYSAALSLEGYQPKTVSINITAGQRTQLAESMSR